MKREFFIVEIVDVNQFVVNGNTRCSTLFKRARGGAMRSAIDAEETEKTLIVEEVFPELLYNRGGVAIRGYRCREGLTQKLLAEVTGISQHHISEMENGKRTIGNDCARKLALALNCDYRRFL